MAGNRTGAFKGGNTKAQHQFSMIPSVNMPRSTFNRSSGLKTAFDAGWLIPIFTDEALPGDTMNLKTASFARLATPIHAVMDNMYMDFFFFAVPNRLLWTNWERFCGEQDDPGDSIDFTIPQINDHNPVLYSLSDYFGLPIGKAAQNPNALHFRAYNLIYQDWFRDQNLQDSPTLNLGDSGGAVTDFPLRRRGKRHDYFTSCLPWTQKGDPVSLPLGTTAPVTEAPTFGFPRFRNVGDTVDNVRLIGDGSGGVDQGNGPIGAEEFYWDGDDTGLVADLSGATAATINDIREAFQIQRLLEKDARGGTRYTEICKSHFGVVSPDARMQRPEYLGGGTTRVNINPVSATGGSSSSPDVGTIAGYGTAVVDGVGFVKSFTEHCVIIGLVNIRADLTYQQGINRMWTRQTRYDFFWPSLGHLGEQAVLNQEIFYDNQPGTGAAQDQGVFGYQERYAEYRYKPSMTTAIMRSDAAGTLDSWHLALDFASLPALNDTFIQDDPPIDRVIQVNTEPHFIADFFFDYKCARPMSTYSVPGMIDHF